MAGVLAACAFLPTWGGVIVTQGVAVPMPAPALAVGGDAWLVVGRRDLAGFLEGAAPPLGWTVGEQLGAMHSLYDARRRLRMTTRIVGSIFTRIDVQVSPRARRTAQPTDDP